VQWTRASIGSKLLACVWLLPLTLAVRPLRENSMELDKIISGDSAVVLQSFPPDCIDLSVQSPPYDDLRLYDGNPEFDFETIASQLFRVTKPGGVVVWVVGDATVNGSETGTSFKQALYFMQCGFNLHDTMLYETDKPPSNGNRYQSMFEYMFVFSKGSPKTFNPITVSVSDYFTSEQRRKYKSDAAFMREKDGAFVNKKRTHNTGSKVKGNIWYVRAGFAANDEFASDHPAVFPEALARDHILSWSNEGDTILDCFCGSGTTPKMAKVLSRHYIGIERVKKYVSLAEKRLLATNVPLFGLGRGLTPREPDNGDSAPSQAFSQPEFLSDLEGLS